MCIAVIIMSSSTWALLGYLWMWNYCSLSSSPERTFWQNILFFRVCQISNDRVKVVLLHCRTFTTRLLQSRASELPSWTTVRSAAVKLKVILYVNVCIVRSSINHIREKWDSGYLIARKSFKLISIIMLYRNVSESNINDFIPACHARYTVQYLNFQFLNISTIPLQLSSSKVLFSHNVCQEKTVGVYHFNKSEWRRQIHGTLSPLWWMHRKKWRALRSRSASPLTHRLSAL